MKQAVCHICRTESPWWGDKNGYDLYSCRSCGLLFVSPIPENLEAFYSEAYFKKTNDNKEKTDAFGYSDYDGDKEPMKGIFLRYLKKLEALAPGKDIFDVGAATGYFLDLAKQQGWTTAGTEISQFAAEEASRRGHAVVQKELPLLIQEKHFSVVTMWDVLEHVPSPKEYLVAANRLLSPGGALAINTPDAGSLFAKIMGKRWHLLVPPEHLYYYSKKNIGMLLEETGFEILEENKAGKHFSLAYIFGTLHRWQGLRLWGVLSRFFDTPFWRKFAIPINLRDNMFIIAKKIKDV